MSELIAEARVLVTPDTTGFRAALVAETTAAAKGVVVPVQVTPVVTSVTGAAGTAALVAAQEELAVSTASATTAASQQARAIGTVTDVEAANTRAAVEGAAAARASATARAEDAAAAAAQSRSLSGLGRGAGSAAASLLGVRGATLAATGPFIAGAAGAIAFGKAIGIATSFNSQLAVFAATTGATADEMERVSEASQQLGKDISLPAVSAGDAAEAFTEFAKAGLSVNDAIAAGRGGLQLATAAQLSNADAVELTANALNAFKLSGDQAVHVADTLANAANSAQGSIADIGLGLKQAAGAAAVVGVSFEDTTALLTLLAKNGLTASDAGTSLRTAFIRLVNPSKQAQKILKDLNINLRDAQGNVRPEVFAEFAAAQQNLAKSTQQANAAIVFGQDAFRAFGVLGQEGAAGLNQVRDSLDQTGTAAKIANARMVGVAGATANLKNQLETLGLVAGQAASGPLADLLNELASYVGVAEQAVVQTKNLAGGISSLADSVPGGGFLVDVGKTGFKFGNIIGQINTIKNLIGGGGDSVSDQAKKTGAEIASAIEDSGRIAARGAVSFGDQITGALEAAFALANKSITDGRQKLRAAQLGATAGGAGQQAGLEEQFSGILASGGSLQAQIANLKRQAEVQGKIIEEAGPNAAGVLLERRRAAREKLASINQQITGIEKGIAADAKAAQQEQQRTRDAAAKERADAAARAKAAEDAAFLQAQEDSRGRQERLVGLADETASTADDIRSRQALRVLDTQQIAALRASALDADAKKQAIKDLAKARQATTDEINRLVITDREQKQAQKQEAAEALASARLELAQTTFDLTGAKAPLERALDAEIKRQIGIKNAAKKGSLAFIQAQTAIRGLLKQKKDLNDEVKDAAKESGLTGGTSLVDLFNENQRIFDQIGNVGQSAAGLTTHAQNASISAIVQHQIQFGGSPAATAQQKATDALTRAIVELTNKLGGQGNFSLGVPAPGTGPVIGRSQALAEEQRFFYQKQAKAMVEQGLG